MKRRLFRLLAIITVLTILLFAVPSTAVFAAGTLILLPTPLR